MNVICRADMASRTTQTRVNHGRLNISRIVSSVSNSVLYDQGGSIVPNFLEKRCLKNSIASSVFSVGLPRYTATDSAFSYI
jgi:hypothetical protein